MIVMMRTLDYWIIDLDWNNAVVAAAECKLNLRLNDIDAGDADDDFDYNRFVNDYYSDLYKIVFHLLIQKDSSFWMIILICKIIK